MKTFTIARIPAKAVLPAFLVAAVTESTIAERPSATVAYGQFSDSENAVIPLAPTMEQAVETRAYFEQPTEWTRAMDKRFRDLVKQEAFGTATPSQMAELERMTRERRSLQYPRSADEVLWEAKQREVTGNLVGALKRYVEFHKAPHRSRAST